jgi:hypothetical protein
MAEGQRANWRPFYPVRYARLVLAGGSTIMRGKQTAREASVNLFLNLIRGVVILILMGLVFGFGACGAMGMVAGLGSIMHGGAGIVVLGAIGLGIAWLGVMGIIALSKGFRHDAPPAAASNAASEVARSQPDDNPPPAP